LATLQAKIKKHSAFEQELMANHNGVDELKKYGDSLVKADHFAKDDISSRVANMLQEWSNLTTMSADKAQKLKEASQLVDFAREVREVRSWIEAKTVTASCTEAGVDVDHCLSLQKQFDEFYTDMTANYNRVDSINKMTKALLDEGHPQRDVLTEHKQVLLLIFWVSPVCVGSINPMHSC
jgi:hypothetical protein